MAALTSASYRSFGDSALYDFSQLSPIDFEELVRDLFSAHFGVHVEAFGPGVDQGIDARFSGKRGATIIQAKHYVRSGKNALLQSLKREVPKVQKLKPNRYIIATSISLNPNLKNQIKEIFESVNLVVADIFGQEDINALLRENPRVEKSHFKLWLSSTAVLERIVHSEIYNRTEIELEVIEALIPKFVQNKSIDEAEAILSDGGSLIISGHPGVGKTTLARMLSWLHASQGWDVFVIDDISDAYKIPNNGTKRLVLFDDFLGQVRLSPDHVRGLDSKLPPLLSRAEHDKNLRIILTTRQYILSQAFQISHRLTEKSNPRKYVLNVGSYTRLIRARILYNHIYFSGLSTDQINSLIDDKFYLKIIDHPNFNPRLIEILTSPSYSRLSSGDFRASVERILENPHQLWERPFREHISEDARALLIATLLFDRVAPLGSLRSSFPRISKAMGLSVPPAQEVYRFNSALKELEGSAIYIVNDTIQFSNPGVRDYLQSVVTNDFLIAPLLTNSETFQEVKACWGLSETSRALRPPTASDSEIWRHAMEVQRLSGAAPILEGILLCLQIHGYFGDIRLLHIAMQWVESMEGVAFDSSETDELLELLSAIDSFVEVGDAQDNLRVAVTNAIYLLLENHADEVPLADVEQLHQVLSNFNDVDGRGTQAWDRALTLIIEQIEYAMQEFGTVEELDEFEERLKFLVEAQRYNGPLPQLKIEERREYLEYKETEGYSDYERSHRTGSVYSSPDSDSSISSMFDNLNR